MHTAAQFYKLATNLAYCMTAFFPESSNGFKVKGEPGDKPYKFNIAVGFCL